MYNCPVVLICIMFTRTYEPWWPRHFVRRRWRNGMGGKLGNELGNFSISVGMT